MLRDDEPKFDHVQVRALFGSNKSYIKWPLSDAGSNKHVPQKVVQQILSVLGIKVSSRENNEGSRGGGGFNLKACIHPIMSNDKSEDLIKAGSRSIGDNGRFFLRKRPEANQYVLSLVFKNKVTHHLIAKNGEGLWTVNKKPYGSFKNLPGLIAACAKTPLPKGWPQQLKEGVTTSGNVVSTAGGGGRDADHKSDESHYDELPEPPPEPPPNPPPRAKGISEWGAVDIATFLQQHGLGAFTDAMGIVGVATGKTFIRLKAELFPPGSFSEENRTLFDAAMFKLRANSGRVDYTKDDTARFDRFTSGV